MCSSKLTNGLKPHKYNASLVTVCNQYSLNLGKQATSKIPFISAILTICLLPKRTCWSDSSCRLLQAWWCCDTSTVDSCGAIFSNLVSVVIIGILERIVAEYSQKGQRGCIAKDVKWKCTMSVRRSTVKCPPYMVAHIKAPTSHCQEGERGVGMSMNVLTPITAHA